MTDRPSYESSPERLRTRISILNASPQTIERDTLIRWYELCLKRLSA